MATKGGIPRVGVEQYNTNIKAPGINKGTGAYFRGDVEKIADYSRVNDSIQKSIKQAGEDLGQFMASERERTSLDPEMAAELGLDPKGSYNRGDFIASQMTDGMSRKEARKAWRKAKKGSDPVDVDDTSTEEKKSIVAETADTIGEKSENSYQKAAEDLLGGKNFNQLNRRQKILAKKNLNKLAKSKENIATLMGEWAGAEVDDISWKKYGSHPEVSDFMQYIINGDGAAEDLPYTFSNENGGTIMYGDGKKLLMRDLEAGKNIYATADNKQLKKDVAATTKNNVAILNKAEDAIIKTLNDQATKPEDPAYSYNRETNIRDMVKAEYNSAMYEDVWNAEMRGRFTKGRYVNYNSKQHEALVQDYLFEQYNEKMGEQNPLVTRDVDNITTPPADVDKSGRIKVVSKSGGYKYVDPALYNRVKTKIMPVFAEMSKDPDGIVYTAGDKNNPMPKISRDDYNAIVAGTKSTSKLLDGAVERDRKVGFGDNHINDIVSKFNKGEQTLTAKEQDIIKAYKAHLGAFDETMDLTSMFDKQTGVKNPIFNRVDKIVTLDIKEGSELVEKIYDLKIPGELEEFQSLIIERSGDDMTDGTFILDGLIGDFKYTAYKAPAPVFKKAEEQNVEQTDEN